NRPRQGRQLRRHLPQDRTPGDPARAAAASRDARLPRVRRARGARSAAPATPLLDLSMVRQVQSARGRAMRVLHAPAEIAGQASVLARGLREIGVDAHSLAYNPGFPHYQPDEMKPYDDLPAPQRYAGYLKSLVKHLRGYDVYHFHFGRTLVPP